MSETQNRPATLHLAGLLGASGVPCAVVGETPQRYRVRLLRSCRLPSGRTGWVNDVVLVPKHALTFLEAR
jgi:hypothetical protein